VAVAVLAALVLVGILLVVARTDPGDTRGYAEFTMFREGCQVDRDRRRNIRVCVFAGRGVYIVNSAVSLEGATAIVSRASCCPGEIAASVVNEHQVVVVIPPVRRDPVRASIVLP
jgi:hypothetical protein